MGGRQRARDTAALRAPAEDEPSPASSPVSSTAGTPSSSPAAGADGAEAAGVPESLSHWHAFLLRKAAQRVSDLAGDALSPYGLTLRHFGVLSLVADEPGQNQRAIGAALRIDRTTIVALTDDLEEAGLVKRVRGVDRRTYAVVLTSTGSAQLNRIRRLVGGVHDELLAPLSADEQEQLRSLLLKLVAG